MCLSGAVNSSLLYLDRVYLPSISFSFLFFFLFFFLVDFNFILILYAHFILAFYFCGSLSRLLYEIACLPYIYAVCGECVSVEIRNEMTAR